MNLRYDFGQRLDITKFEKQAEFFISINKENEFLFYFKDFKLILSTLSQESTTSHKCLVWFIEPNVSPTSAVIPLNDSRFKEFKSFQMFTKPNGNTIENIGFAEWESNSAKESVKKIVDICRVIHKINSLKMFI